MNRLIKTAEERLSAMSETPRTDALLLFEEAAGVRAGTLYTDGETSPEALARFEELLARRETGEPVAYITRKRGFMHDEFYVNEHVLIPRPDTEHLVESSAELIRARGYRSALEIGTGSGCVAVSLAKITGINVTACDISEEALAVARLNAENIGGNVEFLQSDCFSGLAKRSFDVVISNPPYLLPNEAALLPFEPKLALIGGGDGLSFYRRISAEAGEHLNPRGLLIFEIGWNQLSSVTRIMEQNGFKSVNGKKDYGGNPRVVWGFHQTQGD